MPALAALTLISSANAEPPKPKLSLTAPQGLHAFLLRSDEKGTDTFPRTPSFAWTPVRGAVRYEFQLSTSNTFRDNGIVYEDNQVKGATTAVPISLPWITGNPYALYARIRAVLPSGAVSPWSQSVGFNVSWSTIPAPLTSYPGMIRWTPVDGATGYSVWLLDAGKVFSTPTNVADQREYYAFHQDATWTSTVRWRVRASRILYGSRNNSLPAVSYGPWSPVYTSVNPAFVGGEMELTAAISDVVSDSEDAPDAHRLMPGFAFSGDETLKGAAGGLYRVYVFSDKDCVNLVYRGAIVGGPAYAPRSTGPLDLPVDSTELEAAEEEYLADGDEGSTFYGDGMKIISTEADKATAKEEEKPDAGSGSGSGSDSGAGSGSGSDSGSETEGEDEGNPDSTASTGSSAAGGGEAAAGSSLPVDQTVLGAPVDLWDTDWPSGGYYWTVVPVDAVPAKPFRTTAASAAVAGATAITVVDASQLEAEDTVMIGDGATGEELTILSVNETTKTLTLATALKFAHTAGDRVVETSGDLEYRDMELAQDACAAGRVQRFGKSSEPTVASSTTMPFASGLSTTGRLISAVSEKNPVFSGSPLVAWSPALGADGYEVQWSKTNYPWKTEGTYFTFATSASLPMKPGTWYYRVRGLNLSLVGVSQRMAWSDSVKIMVASPRFAVLGGATKSTAVTKSTAKTTQLTRVEAEGEGFAIGIPNGWDVVEQTEDSQLRFEAVAPQAEQGFYSNMNVVAGDPRGSQSMAAWAAALKAEVSTLPLVPKTLATRVVKLSAGNAVKLTYRVKTGDGRQVSIVQYAIDAGKESSFVLTYTTATTLAGKYAALFASSANSFKLTSAT